MACLLSECKLTASQLVAARAPMVKTPSVDVFGFKPSTKKEMEQLQEQTETDLFTKLMAKANKKALEK